ncbi:MAG: GNAT family N-acetyltransferase [Cellvibrionaceae bacterium]|nr:GNAT family N-acetyltransferase [Cellvibrionaceae bacterium]
MMETVEDADCRQCFAFLEHLIIPPNTEAGYYTVRFAQTAAEVRAAQALRYRVFYEEKHGVPSAHMVAARRDVDQWDDAGFHIIVVDTRAQKQPAVVGTLRLFFNECLAGGQHFYTEETFDLQKLHNQYGRSLELSRFCVDPQGRGGVILMLIWKFAMSFLQDNRIEVMFGCASFSGKDVQRHLPILHYLYAHHLAPEALRPSPKVADYIDLNSLFQTAADWQQAQKSVPTLLRGYLKLGAKISDAAIIDPVFNTVYVAIYVETNTMLQQNPNLVTHV